MDTTIRCEARVREPWNKGKVIGAKPPLRPKHVWAVRTRLQLSGRYRDLAMFNLAIDSKLRGCDVVSLKIVDAAWLCARSSIGPAAQNRKTRSLRDHGANAPGN
jgi:hypothetical protein